MPTRFSILLLLVSPATIAAQASAFDYSGAPAVIRAHCAREWPDDYSMRAYCEKQQNEAVRTLQGGQPAGVPLDRFRSIRENCSTDWPEDYAMRAYCEKQQFAALADLARPPAQPGSSEDRIISAHCAREWPNDFSMRAYCQRQQRAAVEALSRGRPADIPDEAFTHIRRKCASEWPEDFSMREFCERQQYDGLRSIRH